MGQTSAVYFKALSIVHIALVSGLLLFGLIVTGLLLRGFDVAMQASSPEIFYFLIPPLALLGMMFGNYYFRKKLSLLHQQSDLRLKMAGYRGALVSRYTFIEGPAFLTIIAALLTRQPAFLTLAAILVLYMILLRPGRRRAIIDLALNPDERAKIENPDEIIAVYS